MKKIKNLIKYDKKIMTLLNIISIIGIIAGSIFIIILNKSDKELVVNSISNFFSSIKNNNFDYKITLINSSLSNLLISFFIWLLGISVIGVIATILILFYKAFLLGFTTTAIIYTYSIKGVLLAIFYCLPHLIINFLILLYLGSYSIKLSIILIKSIFKKENLNFKQFINNYLKILLVSVIILIISALYETFLASYILKFISGIIL